jgi:ankyrin repeat protein
MSRYTEDIITYIINGDTDRAAKAIYNIPSDSSLTLKQKLLDEALEAAVNNNNIDIVRVALKNGANPNYVNSSSYFEETLLEIATRNGNDDIIKLLTAAQTVGTTSNSSSNSSSSGETSNSSSSPVNLSNEIPTNDPYTESNEPNPNDTVNAFGGRRRKLKKAKKSRKVKKSKKSRKSKKGKKYTRRNA